MKTPRISKEYVESMEAKMIESMSKKSIEVVPVVSVKKIK